MGCDVKQPLAPITIDLNIKLMNNRAHEITNNKIVLDNGQRIAFERCIVATDSHVTRTTPGSTKHTYTHEPKPIPALRTKLTNTKHIIVLNSDLTNVEVATEITKTIPDHKMTLMTRTLTPSLTPRARAHVQRVLARLRVTLVLGDVDRVTAKTI